MGRFNKEKTKRGGKHCIADGPRGSSCTNTQYSEVSLHKFPNKTKYPGIYRQWLHFARRHRPNYNPSNGSVICSEHFDVKSFERNPKFAREVGIKIKLKPTAIPTIHVTSEENAETNISSARERRQVNIIVLGLQIK